MPRSHKKQEQNEKNSKRRESVDSDTQSKNDESVYKNINKVEKQLGDLEERLEKKMELVEKCEKQFNYSHLIKSLLCDNQIQFGGCTAYGTFYSHKTQSVLPKKNFIFECKTAVKNFHFKPKSDHIKVLVSGVYTVNLTMQTEAPAQVALFVNNKMLGQTVIASNNTTLTLTTTLSLKSHDIIKVKNCETSNPIVTALPVSGLICPSQNLSLSLVRIAVLKCKEYNYRY